MPFGDRLKALREAAGLTQQALATAAGLSIGAVREYEQGRSEPVLSNAFLLATALGVGVDAFAGSAEGAEPAPKKAAPKRKGKK